ncbi:MAG: phage tail tape measure protein [Cloacibacillus porcorum]|uniref:phage tail tape measure protein n=1 Tax=Cloacibacillus porcorum TaxID=1197717 RepID=UPI0023EF95E3|nr:phage tail tape measure protein [Cloacibacillus porcorum]MCD7875777.1 phage tail tape measure protein [Cloacibacillus porcorum]
MSNLSIGLIIGAALSSGFYSAIGSATSKISQLDKKGQSLKLGETIGKQFQEFRAETLRVRKEFEASGYKSKELGTKLKELQRSTQTARAEAQKYGFNIKKVGEETRLLGILSQRTEAQIGRMQARMARAQARSAMKSELLGVTGMAYGIGRAIQPAIEFEEAFADVRKVVDDTDEEFDGLKKDILNLSTVIPMAGGDLTRITAAAGQTGIKGRAALLDFTTTAAKMGVAFDITADEAGKAMAEIKNGCKISQPEVTSLGDAINHLSNNTAADAPKLVEYMRRVGSIGKLAGISSEKIAALGTAFIATGTAPEVAARASNDLIMKLSSVTKQSKNIREAFQALGYTNLSALEHNMLKAPQQTILGFLKKVSSKKNKLSILSSTIGTGFADDIAKMVNGLGNYEEALRLVADKSNYAGSMEKEFEARSKTTANAIQLLKNQMTLAANNLGSVFLPYIAEGAQKLGSLISKFAAWAEQNPETIKIIGSAVAGFVALKAGSLAARWGFSYIMDAASLLNGGLQMLRPSTIQAALALLKMKSSGSIVGGVISMLKGHIFGIGKTVLSEMKIAALGVKALGTAILTTPIGWFLLAAVAIGTAAYFVWKNWDTVKAHLIKFWGYVKTTWSAIGEAIKAPFVAPMQWIGDKIDWLSQKWEGIKSVLGGSVSAPTTKAGKPVPMPGNALGGIFSQPHIAAISEGGKKEAVIPLEGNSRRARSIYAAAGQHLGIRQQQAAGVTVNASININAPSGGDAANIAQEVLKVFRDLERKARTRERGRFAEAPIFG